MKHKSMKTTLEEYNSVQCQIYNYWTGENNGGHTSACRLIIQSPTGAAYYLDYPTFAKYYNASPSTPIGKQMYDLLHRVIVESDNINAETWTMTLPIEYLKLFKEYGQPIVLESKPAWMDFWLELQTKT
jgi:hypothetical protein